jgi:two-component system copper resistance phosphate regulon response regulator CusR
VRLLLVEDEPLLAKRLRRGLEEESYAVDVAGDGASATEMVIGSEYDLIILDLMLPDASGIDLLAEWREDGTEAPVLILTARDQLDSKLRGFEAGADDYLTKPFDFEELLARVRSLLRRRQAPPAEILDFADLRLDRARRSVERGGRSLNCTHKEFALLEYFMLHPGIALDRVAIAEHVWDASYEGRSNVIDVIIARLRSKLEKDGAPRLLHTVKGVGYALRDNDGGEP